MFKYLKCIKEHTCGTYLIKEGTAGKVTNKDKDYVTIELYDSSYSLKIRDISMWSYDIAGYFKSEICSEYYNRYNNLSYKYRTDIKIKIFCHAPTSREKIQSMIDEACLNDALS